jgi:hypothetical protein
VVSIGDAREGVVMGDAQRLHSVKATLSCGGEAMVRVGGVVATSEMLSNIVSSTIELEGQALTDVVL